MTHDPLCPHIEFIPCCESYLEHEYPQPAQQHYIACQCDLIAQVRADERSAVIDELQEARDHWDFNDRYLESAGLATAVEGLTSGTPPRDWY